MRYIIIDPAEFTISEHFGDGKEIGLELMKKEVGARFVSRLQLGERLDMWHDDEFLLDEDPEQRFFKIGTYDLPIGGKALICGLDRHGNSIGLTDEITVRMIEANISWIGDAKSLEVAIQHGRFRRPQNAIISADGSREVIGEWRDGAWIGA